MTYTIAEIQRMLDAATPGPWRDVDSGQSVFPESDPEFDGLIICELPQAETEREEERNTNNFKLIAATPTIIRDLLAERALLRAALERIAGEGKSIFPLDCNSATMNRLIDDAAAALKAGKKKGRKS